MMTVIVIPLRKRATEALKRRRGFSMRDIWWGIREVEKLISPVAQSSTSICTHYPHDHKKKHTNLTPSINRTTLSTSQDGRSEDKQAGPPVWEAELWQSAPVRLGALSRGIKTHVVAQVAQVEKVHVLTTVVGVATRPHDGVQGRRFRVRRQLLLWFRLPPQGDPLSCTIGLGRQGRAAQVPFPGFRGHCRDPLINISTLHRAHWISVISFTFTSTQCCQCASCMVWGGQGEGWENARWFRLLNLQTSRA